MWPLPMPDMSQKRSHLPGDVLYHTAVGDNPAPAKVTDIAAESA